MGKFSERLRQLKEESNFTAKDMAEKSGISASNIYYYLSGGDAGCDILVKLANAFNVSVDWLVGNSDLRNGGKGGVFKLGARITKEAEFSEKELQILINASLAEDNDPVVEEAQNMLRKKFNSVSGMDNYMPGSWIEDIACKYDEKYNNSGFGNIDF